MGQFKDLTGKVFGELTVLRRDPETIGILPIRWICKCSCGVTKSILGGVLTKTKSPTRSCGHIRKKDGRLKDLLGKTFGHLKVVARAGSTKSAAKWLCVCSCGNTVEYRSGDIISGAKQSCGCKNQKQRIKNKLLYKVWTSMKSRVLNPRNKSYHNYGGRGIKVCERWKNSYNAFYDDVHEGYQKGLDIDRINNDGHYQPGNTRWATRKVNIRNGRQTKLTEEEVRAIRASSLTQTKLARMFGVSRRNIRSILNYRTWN